MVFKKISRFWGVFLCAVMCMIPVSCDKQGNNPGPEPAKVVELHKFQDGIYFGNFWKEGFADYYFIVSSGEIGYIGDQDYLVPVNEGEYIMYFDIWGDISSDHTNPVVPEGVYTLSEKRANHTFNPTLTFATVTTEKDGDRVRVQNVLFEDGTITVAHCAKGYRVTADVVTTEGAEMQFVYEGEIVLADKSGEGDEIDNSHINANLDLKVKRVTKELYKSEDNFDNYIIRCFDTEKTSGEGLYPFGPGHKIQLDLYVEKGSDLTGTYKIGTRLEYNPGTFYPGVWFGGQALGTFCMQTDRNYKSRFCTISDGKVTIGKNADGTYSIACDLTDSDGYSIKASWTGNIEERSKEKEPETSLTEDVDMVPLQCSAANYYGDFMNNGTINYGIVLASELELLNIDFIAGLGNASALPAGTYKVSSDGEPWTVTAGKIGISDAEPSCYIRYQQSGNDFYPQSLAPIAGGTMTISCKGDEYTIEFDFEDDYNLNDKTLAPHHIRGTWTGKIPEITDYTNK